MKTNNPNRHVAKQCQVLIVPKWNGDVNRKKGQLRQPNVLIPKWNGDSKERGKSEGGNWVLIVPEWNGNYCCKASICRRVRGLNRTRVEWKRVRIWVRATSIWSLNRTRVEWKLWSQPVHRHTTSCLNRTRVEWKLSKSTTLAQLIIRSNRTRVEWKPLYNFFLKAFHLTVLIVPEWNGNSGPKLCPQLNPSVPIVPEWNGNFKLWTIQSSSWGVLIVPEWNVNHSYLMSLV